MPVSFDNHNRYVTLAIVVSCGPKFNLDGAEITNGFWVVHVNVALLKTEDLVLSHENDNTR